MHRFSARFSSHLIPTSVLAVKTFAVGIRTPGATAPGMQGQTAAEMSSGMGHPVCPDASIRYEEIQGMRGSDFDPRIANKGDISEENSAPPAPTPKPDYEPRFFTYDISTDARTKGLTTIVLRRDPVNSLNLEFLQELNDYLAWMGDEEEVSSLIVTSETPSVFSAGLDIAEMYIGKDESKLKERFPQFWILFQQLFFKLNTFPKPVVAAVNGNAPAAGCVLALCCDYRIMLKHGPTVAGAAPKLFRIGLNEIKLGLVCPPWVMLLYSHAVGSRRKAERLLQLGETPTADEACALGMIDEVLDPVVKGCTTTKEAHKALMDRAQVIASKYQNICSDDAANYSRWLTRDVMRNDVLTMLSEPEACEQDVMFFSQVISSPDVQARLQKYVERISAVK